MRISKINNVNFKGLWERKNEKLVNLENNNTPIIKRTMIYHPFYDETIEETENAFSKEKTRNVYEGYDEYYNLVQYIVNDFQMGAPLRISKEDYKEIEHMEKHAFPYPFSSTYFINSNNYPNEVKQTIED